MGRGFIGGALLHSGHNLLNKGVCIQLVGVCHMAVHNPSLRKSSPDSGGVNVGKIIAFTFLLGWAVLLLLLVIFFFGMGNHLIKVQVAKVSAQIVQIMALERHHHFTINLIDKAEVNKVGADFNGMLTIAGTAKGKVNVMEVGKICFLLKFLLAVFIDKLLRFFQGRVVLNRFRGRAFLHHLKQTVIQRVLRQQAVKFLAG